VLAPEPIDWSKRTLFSSIGKLRYGFTNLVLDVDQDIVDYYRWLLPRSIWLQTQMYPAHISVIRNETVPRMDLWGKYENEEIAFSYSNVIRNGTLYYWLDCFSNRLEEIRAEIGLINDSLYIQTPLGYAKTFHITLGNFKEQVSSQSSRISVDE
jgi:hypothetical protein